MANMEVTKHGQMGTNKMDKMEITKHVERIPHLATRLNVGSQVENKWMGHKILKGISQNVMENILWRIHLFSIWKEYQLNCQMRQCDNTHVKGLNILICMNFPQALWMILTNIMK